MQGTCVVTDLLIPCLEVYALRVYSKRHSRLTTVLINLQIHIPARTKMRTNLLHCPAPCSRFKTCNTVNSTYIHDFTTKSNQDFLADSGSTGEVAYVGTHYYMHQTYCILCLSVLWWHYVLYCSNILFLCHKHDNKRFKTKKSASNIHWKCPKRIQNTIIWNKTICRH